MWPRVKVDFIITFCSLVFRATLYQVFLVKEWGKFSNHGGRPGKPQDNYGHYSSTEVVHDAVHDAVGGAGGHTLLSMVKTLTCF